MGVPRFSSSALLPFVFGVSSIKPNIRKKGTLIVKGLITGEPSLEVFEDRPCTTSVSSLN